MGLFDKLMHLGEGRSIKRLEGIAKQVNLIEPDFEAMSDDELRGQTAVELLADSASSLQLATLVGRITEVEARHKAGQRVSAELTVSRMAVPDDIHYVLILRDISERRKAESAEAASVAKSAFLEIGRAHV